METIRFIDLLANVGELREIFEKSLDASGLEVKCMLTAEVDAQTIQVYENKDNLNTMRAELSKLRSEEIPTFDFLLASFPIRSMENGSIIGEKLFSEIERILNDKRPYGFIIEKIEQLVEIDPQSKVNKTKEKIDEVISVFEKLGYKLSWRLVDSNDRKKFGKRIIILGTLGSATVLSDFQKDNQSMINKSRLKQEEILEKIPNINFDSLTEVTKVQKELLRILLEANRKKDKVVDIKETPVVDVQKVTQMRRKQSKNNEEKEVYFKLYPPKKLVEITKEDGSVTGLVHSFIFQEVFEETVKELDFARNLNSDLKALFTSADEQIIVIDKKGEIIRVSSTFIQSFWGVEKAEEIIGKNIQEFVERNIFQPDVFQLCIKKQDKVTAIQESGNMRVWSVATPVYKDGELERVVVLSKEIIQNNSTVTSVDQSNDLFTFKSIENKRLIFRSNKIENLVTQLTRAAKMNSTILIEGETGVGKELFAHKVHEESMRNDQPLIRINCGAIPEQLMESELFGYEKGAFTGADQKGKIGYFELAHNGTIFLDEIGELPLNMQVKLLRVLQEREITRIGGTHPISVDVRIIAATNRNLRELVQEGEFREDLYYRLNVIPFTIPPLRKRKEDVFPLAVYFLEQQKKIYNIKKSFTPEAIKVLETYDWPGNIRELQNIIERLLIFSDEEWIKREDVLMTLYGSEEQRKQQDIIVLGLMPLKEAVKEVEKQLIELGMREYNTAAELSKKLEISPATLSRRMKEINNNEKS